MIITIANEKGGSGKYSVFEFVRSIIARQERHCRIRH